MSKHAMAAIRANLPAGIEPTLVADQPMTVEHAVDEFMKALAEAVAIVLAVSLSASDRERERWWRFRSRWCSPRYSW